MKLRLFLALALLLTAFGLLAFSPALQGREYSAERYDVLVDVQPGGDLIVTEMVVFRFVGGPYTFVFRELDPVETDGISDISASLDGQPLPEGTEAGQVEIEPGDPIEVTWHFEPVSNAAHTFELSYRVQGAIRQGEADTLIWRAVPEEHEYTIDSSTITLRYPQGVALAGEPELSQPAQVVETSGTEVRLEAGNVDEDDPVILTADFQAGSLITAPPQWQARQARRSQDLRGALPFGLGSAAIVLLGALAAIFGAMRGAQREGFIAPDAPQRLTSPPADLPPALGVKLASGSAPGMATLFDLARRGFLRFEENPGRWGRSFTVYRQPQVEALRPHERVLLDALFNPEKGARDSLSMQEVGQAMTGAGSRYSAALDDELQAAGWLDPERKTLRRRVLGAGVTALLLGLVMAIPAILLMSSSAGSGTAGVVRIAAVLAGVAAALVVAGLVAIFAGASISTLTNPGEYAAARWKAFFGYLREVSRGREPAVRPDLFELYLPYTAAAGFAQEWAKFFQKQGEVPLPVWFNTQSGSFSGGEFAAIIALMATTDASSSSTGAGAGGAGASGGGASGAG